MPDFTTGVKDGAAVPYEFALGNNYPNPFNPATTIKYSLAAEGNVRLDIYNTLGQLVSTIVDEKLTAGEHVANWNGRDNTGKQVASGIYFYQLYSNSMVQTKKMMLLK